MKRAIVRVAALVVIAAACSSTKQMSGSYAVILDPSVGFYASPLRAALSERLANADFIDVVLPADKHEAIVVVRGIGCLNEFDSSGCGAIAPKAFEYEIYRDGASARKGQTPVTGRYDQGAEASPGATSYATVAARSLAGDVVRALRRG